MADNVEVDPGTGLLVSTDELGDGSHAQQTKLLYSADGVATRVPADADGLLVNLGTNNDVTLGAAIPAGTNNIGDVDIASALPAGDNNIGNVDLASAIPAGNNNIGDVDIASALPAGNNNIGDVDIASALPAGTNNIGDVDVLSLVPGTGATALGKAVDSAAGATDTGTAALVVRDDALTTLTPADGDYTHPRVTSVGRLWTSAVIDTALPAGTANIGDVDIASIAAGDNNIGNVDIVTMPGVVGGAAHDAAVSGAPLLAGGYASAAAPSDVSGDGDAVRAWLLRNGATAVQLTAAGALIPGDATNGLRTYLTARTAGGTSIHRSIDLDETEEEIKATAGQVFGWFVKNRSANEQFVHFYNATAANVTVGSTTPVFTLTLEAKQAANVLFDVGIAFGTAITVAATTTLTGADAPAANDCVIAVFYA